MIPIDQQVGNDAIDFLVDVYFKDTESKSQDFIEKCVDQLVTCAVSIKRQPSDALDIRFSRCLRILTDHLNIHHEKNSFKSHRENASRPSLLTLKCHAHEVFLYNSSLVKISMFQSWIMKVS